jgi:ubiquinone/menaquinone biosynthesis C-methylase UbiE
VATYSENFEKYKVFLNKVVRYDFSMFEIPHEKSILDVGCGFGDRVRILRDRGYQSVSGVEIDEYSVKTANDPLIKHGSIESTGFPEKSFDVVLVENVFHHISDYDKALREIKRILKPEGTLCFIEPRNTWIRRFLDFVTFKTPVPKIFKGPWKMRYDVMEEEFATGLYPKWLRSHSEFFKLLDSNYQLTWQKKNPFFYFGKAEINEKK